MPKKWKSKTRPWRETVLSPKPDGSAVTDGAQHETWADGNGRIVLERWLVPGLGHGTPVGTAGAEADQVVGTPGPHMLAAPISSTWHLARSWGLLTQAARPRAAPAQPAAAASPAGGSVIERALRSAGLMR